MISADGWMTSAVTSVGDPEKAYGDHNVCFLETVWDYFCDDGKYKYLFLRCCPQNASRYFWGGVKGMPTGATFQCLFWHWQVHAPSPLVWSCNTTKFAKKQPTEGQTKFDLRGKIPRSMSSIFFGITGRKKEPIWKTFAGISTST